MSRNITGCKLTTSGRQRDMKVETNLLVLSAMLSSPPWNMMPLTVTFFDDLFRLKFSTSIPASISLESTPDVNTFTSSVLDNSPIHPDVSSSSCVSCENPFVGKESRIVHCPSCNSYFHARCAANCFSHSSSLSLIPQEACECPVCNQTRPWAEFVKTAFIYGDAQSGEEEPEDECEDDSSSDSGDENVEKNKNGLFPNRQPTILEFTKPKVAPVVVAESNSLRDRLYAKTKNEEIFQI